MRSDLRCDEKSDVGRRHLIACPCVARGACPSRVRGEMAHTVDEDIHARCVAPLASLVHVVPAYRNFSDVQCSREVGRCPDVVLIVNFRPVDLVCASVVRRLLAKFYTIYRHTMSNRL